MLHSNTTDRRPKFRHQRRAARLSLAAALSLLWAATTPAAPLTLPVGLQAASHPENGDTYFLFQGVPYLQLGLQAQNASPASIQTGPSRLAVTFQVPDGHDKSSSLSLRMETSSSFHVEAQSADGASPAYLTFELGQDFRGGRLRALSHRHAKATVYPFPAPTGQIMAKTFELVDSQERVIQISLKQERPAEIVDGTRLRIPLQGQPRLDLELRLPMSVDYIPSADYAYQPLDFPDWYAFKAESPLPADSVYSAAEWLEKPAGKHGRIARQDDQLIYNGQPIKLWGLNNSFANCAPDNEMADLRADFYADLGINSVRLHKYADGPNWAGIQSQMSAEEFDREKLDRMDYFVAALKKRGIYVKLSPVFMTKLGPDDLDAVPYMDEFGEVPTEPGERLNPRHGSFYLSREIQDLQIRQVEKILNHRNPYTGLRYADDPAVAFVELFNEDSALFHGTARQLERSPTLRSRSSRRFFQWLSDRYGSTQAIQKAWGQSSLNPHYLPQHMQDESWSAKTVYPYGNPWHFDPDTLNGPLAEYRQRILDTMAFLYDLQNEVYGRYAQAIRDTGYGGELIASNWRAGRAYSHFLNLHSDSLYGTIDRHNYFGGNSRDPFHFGNASMLAQPGSGLLSSGLQQVADRPFMLSEWIHVYPSEWGAEGIAIIGAYGMGLQGWDVSYAFQNGDAGTYSDRIGGHYWDVTAPQFALLFPAVSRQVHRGDVAESPLTHALNVNVSSLSRGELGFNDEAVMDWDVKSFNTDAMPKEGLAVARSEIRFVDEPAETERFRLERYEGREYLTSATGQLRWRKGKHPWDGHFEMDTPGSQAVVGFAQNRSIELQDAELHPESNYMALYLTALGPNETIANADRILVTAVARARNKDAIFAHDAFLYERGEGPVVMEPVRARIDLRREERPTIHLLDHSGRKTGRTLPVAPDATFHIDTARDQTPFYLIDY